MDILRAILQIIYIGICVVLVFVVLRQEGKSSGLSAALTGASESYWSKIMAHGRRYDSQINKNTGGVVRSPIGNT